MLRMDLIIRHNCGERENTVGRRWFRLYKCSNFYKTNSIKFCLHFIGLAPEMKCRIIFRHFSPRGKLKSGHSFLKTFWSSFSKPFIFFSFTLLPKTKFIPFPFISFLQHFEPNYDNNKLALGSRRLFRINTHNFSL